MSVPRSGNEVDITFHNGLLSPRMAYSEAPSIPLSRTQLSARNAVHKLVATGRYELMARACILCEGREFDIVAKRDRYGLPLSTAVCRTCGLVQANPLMRESDYLNFYEIYYRSLYTGAAIASERFFAQQETIGNRLGAFLSNHLGNLKGLRILEVGCGAGGILYTLRNLGADVMGMDLGGSYLAFGRAAGLDLRVGSLDSLEAGTTFDVIIYCHVLEHVLDPVRELRRACEFLTERGGVLVEVPALESLQKDYLGDLLGYFQNAHIFNFSRMSLENVARRAGMVGIAGDGPNLTFFARAGEDLPVVGDYDATFELLRRYEERWSYASFRLKTRLHQRIRRLRAKMAI